MEKRVKMAELLDFYGGLLSDKQFKTINAYYGEDLSLTEIANIRNISKQGVWESIKKCEDILTSFEEKLHLIKKYKEQQKDISLIKKDISLINLEDKKNSKLILKEIDSLIDKILD